MWVKSVKIPSINHIWSKTVRSRQGQGFKSQAVPPWGSSRNPWSPQFEGPLTAQRSQLEEGWNPSTRVADEQPHCTGAAMPREWKTGSGKVAAKFGWEWELRAGAAPEPRLSIGTASRSPCHSAARVHRAWSLGAPSMDALASAKTSVSEATWPQGIPVSWINVCF